MGIHSSKIFLIFVGFSYISATSVFEGLQLKNVAQQPATPQQAQRLISFDPDDVHFYVFPNKLKPDYMREIIYGDSKSLKTSGLIPNTEVRIYAHGFTGNITNHGCPQLKNAFLKRNYRNIMCLDYEKLATPNTAVIPSDSPLTYPFFPEITLASKVVGRRVAEFLIFLKNEKFIKDYKDVYLIGLSLGAQVSGTAGAYIQQQTGNKIGRITGLDPAGPLFDQIFPPEFKLDKNKAEFVDVLHTGAGLYGTKVLRGHVDFFANGGRASDQEACRSKSKADTCGHAISLDYYQRAILGEKLLGCPCKFKMLAPVKQPCPKPNPCQPTIKFGFPVPKSSFGTYYVAVPLYPSKDVAKDYEPFRSGLTPM